MSIQEEKKNLRAFYSALRSKLQSEKKDEAIASCVSALAGASFFVYYAIGSEVQTQKIIADLLAKGKTVCLPRITGTDMVAAKYAGERLQVGMYGIPAPERGEDWPCEVALVPLLAVDEAGNRLGYGGGFYDKYFRAHPAMLRVGLCYAGQVTHKLPAGEYDMPLHAIVTEEGFRDLVST